MAQHDEPSLSKTLRWRVRLGLTGLVLLTTALALAAAILTKPEPLDFEVVAYGPASVASTDCAIRGEECLIRMWTDAVSGEPAIPLQQARTGGVVMVSRVCAVDPDRMEFATIHLTLNGNSGSDGVASIPTNRSFFFNPVISGAEDLNGPQCALSQSTLALTGFQKNLISDGTEILTTQQQDYRGQRDTFSVRYPVTADAESREITAADLRSLMPVEGTATARTLTLGEIMLTAAIVTSLMASAVLAASRFAQKLVAEAEASREAEAVARQMAQEATEAEAVQRSISERRALILEGILSATHHELNREITLMGFAVDDLADLAEDNEDLADEIAQLTDSFSKVEEGQLNVGALARLGTNDVTDRLESLTASDLTPLTKSAQVVIRQDEPIHGDAGLLKLFVKNAARNAETHGEASTILLSTGNGRLVIEDDGKGCATADLLRGWKAGLRPNGTKSDGTQIMHRIADAHRAPVVFDGQPGRGVRITIDLQDIEIDLRNRGLMSTESPSAAPRSPSDRAPLEIPPSSSAARPAISCPQG